MSPNFARRLPLAGAALFLALALSACGGSEPAATTTAAADAVDAADVSAAPVTAPAAPATTATPPTTAAPARPAPAPPTTAARTTKPSAPPTTAAPAAPATTTPPAPVTPKFAPGQRINPTSAQVQTAAATLTQRIPLFKPNESQLRTFADAACTSFDKGQTPAQVQATVQQAVTYVQGASLSAADAAFAVRTVVDLRCPGYAG